MSSQLVLAWTRDIKASRELLNSLCTGRCIEVGQELGQTAHPSRGQHRCLAFDVRILSFSTAISQHRRGIQGRNAAVVLIVTVSHIYQAAETLRPSATNTHKVDSTSSSSTRFSASWISWMRRRPHGHYASKSNRLPVFRSWRGFMIRSESRHIPPHPFAPLPKSTPGPANNAITVLFTYPTPRQ